MGEANAVGVPAQDVESSDRGSQERRFELQTLGEGQAGGQAEDQARRRCQRRSKEGARFYGKGVVPADAPNTSFAGRTRYGHEAPSFHFRMKARAPKLQLCYQVYN